MLLDEPVVQPVDVPITPFFVGRIVRKAVAGIVDARDREAAPCEIPQGKQRICGIFRVAVAPKNRLFAALQPENDCGDLHAVRADVHVSFGGFAISALATFRMKHERIDARRPSDQRDDRDTRQNPHGRFHNCFYHWRTSFSSIFLYSPV